MDRVYIVENSRKRSASNDDLPPGKRACVCYLRTLKHNLTFLRLGHTNLILCFSDLPTQ